MILFLCETKSYSKSYISFSLKSKHMLRDIFKGTAVNERTCQCFDPSMADVWQNQMATKVSTPAAVHSLI